MVLGGELVALASQLVVVGEVRPSLSGPAGLDEVREQPREPQAVVAQVRPQEEAPLAGVVEPGEVAHDVDEVREGVVVVSPDAGGAVVIAELEHQRRQVVGKVPVDHAGGEKRVPHRHVREEQRRGHDQGTNGEQGR